VTITKYMPRVRRVMRLSSAAPTAHIKPPTRQPRCSFLLVAGAVSSAVGLAARRAREAETLATANAESREALRVLADEQAALRRVATLVARGVPPAEVFTAVAQEVGSVLGLTARASSALIPTAR
jgi:hypothetical protein